MRVLLIDDHPVVLEIMRMVIGRALEGADVLVEGTLEGGLERVRASDGIELALVDLCLPGCDRIESVQRFRQAAPGIPLIVISSIDEGEVIRAAFAAGAKGYIPKTMPVPLMVSAIQFVWGGGTFVPSHALQRNTPAAEADKADPRTGLTRRQLEVLRGVRRGKKNCDIAAELGISENTVKQHLRDIFRILGVTSRAEAGFAAGRRGIEL